MDVEKVALFAGVGFALAVGAFVLWGPSPKPRRRGQVTGIHNLGHTCFLNALLQALAACPILVAWLEKQHDKNKVTNFTSTLLSVLKKINGYTEDLYGDVTPIEIISSLGPLWNFTPGHQDVHELFHVVLGALQNEAQPSNRKGGLSDALPVTEPLKTPSPVDLKGAGDSFNIRSVSCNDITAVEKHHDNPNHHPHHTPNGFDKNYNNHIASSTHSISNVPMGLNKPGMILARSTDIIPISVMIGNNENGMEKEFKRQWNSLHTIPLVLVPALSNEVHPFSGLLTSQLQCTNCDWKSSVRYDKFENVFLPLPPSGGPFAWKRFKLSELFLRFVASELVHDVLCDGCGIRCPAIKTLTLGKLPKCLCLHIPRTNWSNSGMLIKRDDHVIFPEILILDPFTFTETKKRNNNLQNGTQHSTMLMMNHSTPTHGKHRYELRAVVEHRGSDGDSGHFVCYRRGNNPGQWFYTSDTTVENTSLSDVLSASPYLLFYERINESIE